MSRLTSVVVFPAFISLGVLSWQNWRIRDGQISRAISIGALSGLVAALVYDLFRLPFVLLNFAGSHSLFALPLFKVFPYFGAFILGDPSGADRSVTAYAVGWAYHFSNAIGFGIMYVAAIGNPKKRTWMWAIVMAVTLEAGMLMTPYTSRFGIPVSPIFLALTGTAHIIFGITLGVCCMNFEGSRWHADD